MGEKTQTKIPVNVLRYMDAMRLKMDAMRLKIKKIRKYATDNEA